MVRGLDAGERRAGATLRAVPVLRRALAGLGAHGALLAAIGAGLIALGALEWALRAAVTAGPSAAPARVEALWTEHRPLTSHSVAYSFRDGRSAAPVRRVERVPEALYRTLRVGDRVEVAFHPAAPHRAHIRDDDREGLARLFITLGLAAFLGGATQLGLRARDGARLRRLASEGVLVEGRVVRIRATPVRLRRERQYRIDYVFPAPDGRWREGVGDYAPRRALVRLEQGSPVHVLVDRARPERHALARDVLELA